MSYEIIDILHDKELLQLVTERAAEIHYQNFHDFETRINGYTHFFIVKLDGELVAMSGIWRCDKWPEKYFRVGDRSFYFPAIRQKNIGNPYQKENKTINSQLLIPMQTKIVLDQGGLPFYSMLNRPNALRRSVMIQNQVSEYKYKVLDGLYWTCEREPNINDKVCWQSIAVLEEFNEWSLPKKDE